MCTFTSIVLFKNPFLLFDLKYISISDLIRKEETSLCSQISTPLTRVLIALKREPSIRMKFAADLQYKSFTPIEIQSIRPKEVPTSKTPGSKVDLLKFTFFPKNYTLGHVPNV